MDEQDVGLTEDQMLAEAIALSLTPAAAPHEQETQPLRSMTEQSVDSVLSTDSLPRGQELSLRQSSQGGYITNQQLVVMGT